MPPKRRTRTTRGGRLNHGANDVDYSPSPLAPSLGAIPTPNTPTPNTASSSMIPNLPTSLPTSQEVSHPASTFESAPTVTSTQQFDSDVGDTQLSANYKRMTCRWTDVDDRALVNCLIDEKSSHGGTSNGFKPTSWMQAAKALEHSELVNGSKAKDKDTCKSRWQALKKNYLSFKAVASMSGAGWDEATKMISLPPSVWKELAANKSIQGRELSRWENRPFPLYNELAGLIEGNVATGELVVTSENCPPAPSHAPSHAPSQLPMNDDDDTDEEGQDNETQMPQPLPLIRSTPTVRKRKRGSGNTHEGLISEMRYMTNSMEGSMREPIPPVVITLDPNGAPPTTVLMHAIRLVEKQEGISPNQLHEAIDFLADPINAQVYISLNDTNRASWLKTKLSW